MIQISVKKIHLLTRVSLFPDLRARILGDPEVFIDVGSVLNLTCVIREETEEKPAFILWYHGDKVRKKIYDMVLEVVAKLYNLKTIKTNNICGGEYICNASSPMQCTGKYQ